MKSNIRDRRGFPLLPLQVLSGVFFMLSVVTATASEGLLEVFDYDAQRGQLSLRVEQQSLQQVLETLSERLDFQLKGSVVPDRQVSLEFSGSVEEVLSRLVSPGGVVFGSEPMPGDNGQALPGNRITRVWILGEGAAGGYLPSGKSVKAVVPRTVTEATQGGRAFRGQRKNMSPEERANSHVGKKNFKNRQTADAEPAAEQE